MNELYFLEEKYDQRKPYTPQAYSLTRELLFQFLAVVTLMLGAWYLYYRWTDSLNMEALWFAIPLAFAESMMFIGTILIVINFWRQKDTPKASAPLSMADVVPPEEACYFQEKPIQIDIYVPVFNEDPELVRETIRAAKRVKRLESWKVEVFLLDDSRNEAMTQMAKEEGIVQITREGKKGRKAGAMVNAMNVTGGDFMVIIDSDTRLFEDILLNTMGYFKESQVAWVQTPQWFCDLTEGEPLPNVWRRKAGVVGEVSAKLLEKCFGKFQTGEDVFANDPQVFFDIIQRRRNNYNASFCCGATSIHRTDALRKVALKRWVERVEASPNQEEAIATLDVEYIAYHTSEDIYTSLLVHAYKETTYRSVLHPDVESKMLSPLDMLTWSAQRFRYAGGTIDLVKREFGKFWDSGLSLGQKLMYFSTFWSYTGAIWLVILLLSPLIYMFTNIAPVESYSMSFFLHLVPFLFFNQMMLMVATWGVESNRGSQFFIAIFPMVIRAFWDVIRGKPIEFVVTSKVAKEGEFLSLVRVQIGLILLYIVAIIYASLMLLFDYREYLTGFSVNLLWSFYNILALYAIVKAARYQFKG